MYCVPYEVLTDFIAEKCIFISKGIEFLSIHTGDTWRRYKLEDMRVTKSQFFVENIPDFNCCISDIHHVVDTNRLTIKLSRPKVVKKRLTEIKTVDDFIGIINPAAIKIVTNNGVLKQSNPAEVGDQSVITLVSVANDKITIHTKF